MTNQLNTQMEINSLEDDVRSMDLLLMEDFSLGIPTEGEVRMGIVVAHRNNAIMVDIGAKSEGFVQLSDLEKMDETIKIKLAIGNEIPVYVLNPEDKNGNIILSYSKAVEEQDWENARQLQESQEVFECRVIGYNKGGLLTQVGNIRGFVPASQLNIARQMKSNIPEESLRLLVGKPLHVKIIEVDRARNRLILSQRAAQKEMRTNKRTQLIENLQEGDILVGRVVNLADFGAFADIGGMEGLIHVSELSWKRQVKPADILKIGDEVKVFVLSVDQKRQRVALSMKRLEPDPWTLIEQRYHVGQLIEATITKLTDYGAFARLSDDDYDFEGLIHISEMSSERIKHPNQIVHRSQLITARIIRIAPDQKQIGLSLKQVASDKFFSSDMAWGESSASELPETEPKSSPAQT